MRHWNLKRALCYLHFWNILETVLPDTLREQTGSSFLPYVEVTEIMEPRTGSGSWKKPK